MQVSDDSFLSGGGDWTNVIIPGAASPTSAGQPSAASSSAFSHRQSYEIGSLSQNAEYECLVQARNKFGWSEPSRIFHFFTGKRGALPVPRHSELEGV